MSSVWLNDPVLSLVLSCRVGIVADIPAVSVIPRAMPTLRGLSFVVGWALLVISLLLA